jgi:bacillopeptidase F (M6 metalloprotease family)
MEVTEYTAEYDTAVYRNGSQSMRVGIINPADNIFSYSSAWQRVAIPADATSADLKFWLKSVSSSTHQTEKVPDYISYKSPYAPMTTDVQYVLVFDQMGRQHQLVPFQRENNTFWQDYDFDLSEFKGQTIMLWFGVYNDGTGGVTGMYVDDVSLNICTP